MKRVWFRNFAIAMGLMGASPALAQYPVYNSNVGPSSFPVQQPAGSYTLTNWQDSVPSIPSVGQAENLVVPPVAPSAPLQAASPNAPVNLNPQMSYPQQPAYANPGHQMAYPQYGSVNPNPQMTYSQPAPAMSHSQQQTLAPGCTSCGNAPVSQGYVQHGGPAPYAYSAPSIGDGYGSAPSYGGRAMGRHLGNGLPVGAKPYFFGGGVLIFKRIDDYNRDLSITDAGATVLATRDAAMPTMAGFEVMGGRYFNCGRNAIAASFWGLFPEDQMVARTGVAGAYRSLLFRPIGLTSNEFQLQTAALADPLNDPEIYSHYDDATTHRLRRSSEFHNVEINLLGFGVGGASRNFNRATAGTMFSGSRHGQGGYGDYGYGDGGSGACGGYGNQGGCGDCGNYGYGGECAADSSRYATGPCGYVAPACGSKLNLSWLAGIRYLQFNDNLEYAAYGVPALGASVLSYDVYTRNSLVGFQVGGRADYCVGCRTNLYSLARVGVYNNNARLNSRLGTELYTAYRTGDPTMPYGFSRSTNQLSFLSELGTGVGYQFSPKWSATCGYRAIIATGVATAVGNVRYQGQTISGTGIRAQDYLILHGLNIGALYNF